MIKALVLGAGGQDGSLLSEELATNGRQVLGLGRRASYGYLAPVGFEYRQLDLRNTSELDGTLAGFAPDEVYHVAAVHGSAGFLYEQVWADALDVNTKALHVVLEHARCRRPDTRIFYASSAKVFGEPLSGHIDLATPRAGRCLYSATKKASGELAAYYRSVHGICVTVGILFNHESERRPAGFFIPRVCRAVRCALTDRCFHEEVRTLAFSCDWSAARDFMAMAARSLDRGFSGELVFASGRTWSGRAFVEELFARYDLDFRNHLGEQLGGEAIAFEVDAAHACQVLEYRPRANIFDVCAALIGGPPSASSP